MLIKNAAPGRDHKCGNIGALRFFLEDRSVRGVGLLPSHDEGRFDLRLYEGDGYVVVQVDLNRFREILGELGVPAGESIMVD